MSQALAAATLSSLSQPASHPFVLPCQLQLRYPKAIAAAASRRPSHGRRAAAAELLSLASWRGPFQDRHGKRPPRDGSGLSRSDPLPLPLPVPDSEPLPREAVERQLRCDPAIEDCKEPVYQWTGECRRCQGTGLVSFYRKRREVISKCIACIGLGYVQNFTLRSDVQRMDEGG